ncbi:helix-turn-helix domain-containing protein [Streptomyces canus]|uniref:helix-turn-helix domain-containing protein n=1 Tax=Streptomyces canus TaxID=58343 RepID=UPI00386C72E9
MTQEAIPPGRERPGFLARNKLKSHAKAPDAHRRLYRFRFYPTEEQAEQLERTL